MDLYHSAIFATNCLNRLSTVAKQILNLIIKMLPIIWLKSNRLKKFWNQKCKLKIIFNFKLDYLSNDDTFLSYKELIFQFQLSRAKLKYHSAKLQNAYLNHKFPCHYFLSEELIYLRLNLLSILCRGSSDLLSPALREVWIWIYKAPIKKTNNGNLLGRCIVDASFSPWRYFTAHVIDTAASPETNQFNCRYFWPAVSPPKFGCCYLSHASPHKVLYPHTYPIAFPTLENFRNKLGLHLRWWNLNNWQQMSSTFHPRLV